MNILALIYFYLPGAMANIGAVVAKFVPGFKEIKTPVDFGKSFRNIRLVGDHKVWGGVLFGVVLGTIVGVLKYVYFDSFLPQFNILKLGFGENMLLYFLMSVGAVSGDLIKSVLKRQLKRAPHTPWIPFDEIDHSLTSLLLVKLFFPIPWTVIAGVVGVYFFLHIAANWIGYGLKIKSVPY
ncbi:MAG: hypothetical protein ACD_58C00329G0001 [uncultured bacterium]|nr:MAG: hypothetical protein ACD_58C00329G0001 [uncultured bacterium]